MVVKGTREKYFFLYEFTLFMALLLGEYKIHIIFSVELR